MATRSRPFCFEFVPQDAALLRSSMEEKFLAMHGIGIKSKILKWSGHEARMEEDRSAFKTLTRTPAGRPRRRWEGRIKMDLKK